MGAHPADHVEHGAGLVVGAGGTGAAEGLLAHHSAGALVVDVEVALRMEQGLLHHHDGFAVLGEDGAGQGVGRGFVADLQGLFQLVVRIDVHGDDGPEDLLDHGLIVRLLADDNGGLHEPALGIVAVAADHDLAVGAGLGAVNIALAAIEGGLVDDGTQEGVEILHVAHLDFLHHFLHRSQDIRPDALGNEGSGAGRALLALELEGAADDGSRQRPHKGGLMGKDEVLAAGLAHDARIVAVGGDVLADLLPDALENLGGAGEMEAGQLLPGDHVFRHIRAAAGHKVDDARGQTAVHQKLHEIVIGKHRRAGGLPDRHVADDGRGHGEVAADGGSI